MSQGRKKIVAEVRFRLLLDVPAEWSAANCNFWIDGSSHCAANFIDQLADEEQRAHDGSCFTCHRFSGEYLRDASPEDIADLTPPLPSLQRQVVKMKHETNPPLGQALNDAAIDIQVAELRRVIATLEARIAELLAAKGKPSGAFQ